VPFITIAILFVTVFVELAVGEPPTKTVPLEAAKVAVKSEFVFGDSIVTEPVPEAFPLMTTLDIIYPHRTT